MGLFLACAIPGTKNALAKSRRFLEGISCRTVWRNEPGEFRGNPHGARVVVWDAVLFFGIRFRRPGELGLAVMIFVLGASGYIGQAFCRALRMRGIPFVPLSRAAFDYTRFVFLFEYLRKVRPAFLINAAGYSGHPNVDACEENRLETFRANTLLPQIVARACLMTKVPWAHVSTGCIYSGAKVFDDGELRVETDLNEPRIRKLFTAHPDRFRGFSETDEPNFSFRNPSFNFCSGTRALAEDVLKGQKQVYVWRCMIPFDERDGPCNFLSRIQRYPRVFDHITSLSHLGDFVQACLELWERRAPFGTYNIANPGAVSTRQVVEMMQRILKPGRVFKYWADEEEFYENGAKVPRSNCILDVTKLACAGIKMRPVKEALEDSLKHWKPSGHAMSRPSALPPSCLSTGQRQGPPIEGSEGQDDLLRVQKAHSWRADRCVPVCKPLPLD